MQSCIKYNYNQERYVCICKHTEKNRLYTYINTEKID